MNTIKAGISPNITGNIGDCSAVAEQFRSGTFRHEVIVTNSCTGEILNGYTYIDYLEAVTLSTVGLALVVLVACAIVLFFRMVKEHSIT